MTVLLPCILSFLSAVSLYGNGRPSQHPDSIAAGEIHTLLKNFHIEDTIGKLDSIQINDSFISLARVLKKQSDESRANVIASLMNTTSENPGMFRYICELSDKHLGGIESPTHDDLLYIPFLEESLKYPILRDAEKERVRFLLEMAKKNRPGEKAADFTFTSRDGKRIKLSALDSNSMTLLIFYDPDCGHCHETFEALKTSDLPSKLAVVAIDAEEDRELWDMTNNSLPKEWTVGFATDPIQESETYILQTMPAIYLLGKDKTVILKDTDIKQLSEYLNGQHP